MTGARQRAGPCNGLHERAFLRSDHDLRTRSAVHQHLRFLSVDAVQKANSGHPGLPLGAAPMAYVLWTRLLKHNPRNPQWLDRDRFVLSAGHGSMLLYSLLHLTGYELSLDDIKQFRQWGSKTPGHPERGHTPGVEVTTGPLGQGFANAVGMAMAEAHLAARYNRPGFEIDRSPHVRARQRRRPDGRRRLGSGLARRPSAARQADLSVRRQPRHAVRRHRHHVHRGSRAALRRLRLAHRVRSTTATTSPRSTRRSRRARRNQAAVADPGAHASSATARRTSRTPSRRTARRSARTRCA